MNDTLSFCDLDILAWLLHEELEPIDRIEEKTRFYLRFEQTQKLQEAMAQYHGEVNIRLTEYNRHRSRAKIMLFRSDGDLSGI